MYVKDAIPVDRRQVLQLLGLGAGALVGGSALPLRAFAQSRGDTLVLALNISDTNQFDPVQQLRITPPMTFKACYETLVTQAPGDYVNLVPGLAKSWEWTPNGDGWRFHLQEGVTFTSGNPMTAEDVKFSLDRVRHYGEQSSTYVEVVDRIEIVDDLTVDVIMKRPQEPILSILCAPSFSITDKKVVEEKGGLPGPNTREQDKATEWLTQHSEGTGAYKLDGWVANSHINLIANPNHWRGKPAFERIVIRHFEDGAAELLALQQGDADAAFNLAPEQLAEVESEGGDLRVEQEPSLDFMYVFLSDSAEYNKALNNKLCRQAIGYAIDYDGIIKSLLGGNAVRPATFLPIGTIGSTEELTKEIGFREDLDKAKKLLAEAGHPDGFEVKFTYPTSVLYSIPYQVLAQKIQSDVARVGINLVLDPLPFVNFRPLNNDGKLTAGLQVYNPPAVETSLWALATVQRIAKRLNWTPPQDLIDLVNQAAVESNPDKQVALYREYQARMVDLGHIIMLFQPMFRVGVRKEIGKFPLTAAGWMLDVADVTRAG